MFQFHFRVNLHCTNEGFYGGRRSIVKIEFKYFNGLVDLHTLTNCLNYIVKRMKYLRRDLVYTRLIIGPLRFQFTLEIFIWPFLGLYSYLRNGSYLRLVVQVSVLYYHNYCSVFHKGLQKRSCYSSDLILLIYG